MSVPTWDESVPVDESTMPKAGNSSAPVPKWEDSTPLPQQSEPAPRWEDSQPLEAAAPAKPVTPVDPSLVTGVPPPSSVLRRAIGDPAVALAKGVVGLPQGLVGLADIPTGGRVGKAIEDFTPVQFRESQAALDTLYSPEARAAQERVAQADGFVGKVVAGVQNPSTIVNSVIESAPSVIGGGGIARGAVRAVLPKVIARKLAAGGALTAAERAVVQRMATVGGAAGEGVITAGQNVEQAREESQTGTLTPAQIATLTASGALTGFISVLGGKLAQRLKIADVDTLLAGGRAQKASVIRGVIGGAIAEGAFEELPQSAQEQIAQNIAAGRPWDAGVADAAAQGMLAGGVMGAGANAGNAVAAGSDRRSRMKGITALRGQQQQERSGLDAAGIDAGMRRRIAAIQGGPGTVEEKQAAIDALLTPPPVPGTTTAAEQPVPVGNPPAAPAPDVSPSTVPPLPDTVEEVPELEQQAPFPPPPGESEAMADQRYRIYRDAGMSHAEAVRYTIADQGEEARAAVPVGRPAAPQAAPDPFTPQPPEAATGDSGEAGATIPPAGEPPSSSAVAGAPTPPPAVPVGPSTTLPPSQATGESPATKTAPEPGAPLSPPDLTSIADEFRKIYQRETIAEANRVLNEHVKSGRLTRDQAVKLSDAARHGHWINPFSAPLSPPAPAAKTVPPKAAGTTAAEAEAGDTSSAGTPQPSRAVRPPEKASSPGVPNAVAGAAGVPEAYRGITAPEYERNRIREATNLGALQAERRVLNDDIEHDEASPQIIELGPNSRRIRIGQKYAKLSAIDNRIAELSSTPDASAATSPAPAPAPAPSAPPPASATKESADEPRQSDRQREGASPAVPPQPAVRPDVPQSRQLPVVPSQPDAPRQGAARTGEGVGAGVAPGDAAVKRTIAERRKAKAAKAAPAASTPSSVPSSPVKVATDADGDKTVSVPSADRPGLPLKEQKKFLLAEIDKAIEGASDEPVLSGQWTDADEQQLIAARKESDEWRNKRSASKGKEYEAADREVGLSSNRVGRLVAKKAIEQYNTVTIEVPGDGTFRVINTKTAIRDLGERVRKAFPTTVPKADAVKSATVSPTTIPAVGRRPDPVKGVWTKLMEGFASDDAKRPEINKPWLAEGKVMASTNGRLIVVATGISGPVDKPAKGAKQYASIEQVTPGNTGAGKMPSSDGMDVVPIKDTEKFIRQLRQAMGVRKEKGGVNGVDLFVMPDGTLAIATEDKDIGSYQSDDVDKGQYIISADAEYLDEIITFMRRAGNESVELRVKTGTDGLDPLTIVGAKEYAVLMPVRTARSEEKKAQADKANAERKGKKSKPSPATGDGAAKADVTDRHMARMTQEQAEQLFATAPKIDRRKMAHILRIKMAQETPYERNTSPNDGRSNSGTETADSQPIVPRNAEEWTRRDVLERRERQLAGLRESRDPAIQGRWSAVILDEEAAASESGLSAIIAAGAVGLHLSFVKGQPSSICASLVKDRIYLNTDSSEGAAGYLRSIAHEAAHRDFQDENSPLRKLSKNLNANSPMFKRYWFAYNRDTGKTNSEEMIREEIAVDMATGPLAYGNIDLLAIPLYAEQAVQAIEDYHDGKGNAVPTQNTGEQTSYRRAPTVTPEQDAAYMAAVERGDTAEAQRMVDEAAKKAGYTVGPVWHGSRRENGVFNKFEPAYEANDRLFAEQRERPPQFMYDQNEKLREMGPLFWFAKNEGDASGYADGGNTRKFYLRGKRASFADRDSAIDAIKRKMVDIAEHPDTTITGHDGVEALIARDPSQIKSADPITRDDQGRVIPLSERFNTDTADIRYRTDEGGDQNERTDRQAKVLGGVADGSNPLLSPQTDVAQGVKSTIRGVDQTGSETRLPSPGLTDAERGAANLMSGGMKLGYSEALRQAAPAIERLKAKIAEQRKEAAAQAKTGTAAAVARATEKLEAAAERKAERAEERGQVDALDAARDELKAALRETRRGEPAGTEPREGMETESKRVLAHFEKVQQAIVRLREAAEKAGEQDMRASVRIVYDAIRDSLPRSAQGRALPALSRIRSAKSVYEAMQYVQQVVEDTDRRAFTSHILATYKKLMESKSVRVEFRIMAKSFLSGVQLKAPKASTVAKLEALRDYLTTAEANGIDVEVPRHLVEKMGTLADRPLSDMSMQELAHLAATLDIMFQAGRDQFKTERKLWERRKADAWQALEMDTVPVKSRGRGPIGPDDVDSFASNAGERWNKAVTAASKWKLWNAPVDVAIDVLDGVGGYLKANYRIFRAAFTPHLNAWLGEKHRLFDAMEKVARENGIRRKQAIRIGMYAINRQQMPGKPDYGRKKLYNTFGAETPEARAKVDASIDAIRLTPEEQRFYDWMQKTLDSLWPRINEYTKRVWNFEIDRNEFYFPMLTDWSITEGSGLAGTEAVEVDATTGLLAGPDTQNRITKTVKQGFTEKRTAAGDQKAQLDALKVMQKHLDDALYAIHMGEEIKLAQEIASSDRYRAAAGDLGQRYVQEYLSKMARKGGTGAHHTIKLLDILRKNMGIGTLGFNPVTVLVQFSSLIDGFSMIGPGFGAKGMLEALTVDGRKFVSDHMPQIVSRLGGDWSFSEVGKLGKFAYKGIAHADEKTALSVALGAYAKNLHDRGLAVDYANPDQTAIDYAQRTVSRTQASGAFWDVPLAVGKYGSISKAVYQFQTFPMNKFWLMAHDGLAQGVRNGNWRQTAQILFWAQAAFLAEQGIRLGAGALLGMGGDAGDDKADQMARNILWDNLTSVPFFGSIARAGRYGSTPVPILATIADLGRGIKGAVDGKTPETRVKGAIKTGGAVGQILGAPGATTASKFIRGRITTDQEDIRAEIDESVQRLRRTRPGTGAVKDEARRLYDRLTSEGVIDPAKTKLADFRARYRTAFTKAETK